MAFKMIGKKAGMTQRFDETGKVVVCTVIQAEPNVITQIKRKESDGYNALQLSFGKIAVNDPRTLEKRVSKPLLGHFKKAQVEPRVHIAEARTDDVDSYAVGQEIGLALFEGVTHVDVRGLTKGKGFQGVIKRHGFAGGPGAHGSGFHRHGGSCGMRTTPGRTLPGQKKAGHMGAVKRTAKSLKVIAVDPELQILVVEGAVPGPNGGLLYFVPAERIKKK